MPTPSSDTPTPERPAPPGHPGHSRIEVISLDGEQIPVSLVRKILAWAQQNGHALVLPEGQEQQAAFVRQISALMATVNKGDRVEAARALGKVNAGFLDMYRVHRLPEPDLTGVPPREGVDDALRAASQMLEQMPHVKELCRLQPVVLNDTATECQFLIILEDQFQDALDHVASVVAPLTRDAVGEIKPAARLMRAQAEASLPLWQQATPLYKYLDKPSLKAAESRRSNERRDLKADERAEERLGAAARTGARAELEAKFSDALGSVLVRDKK